MTDHLYDLLRRIGISEAGRIALAAAEEAALASGSAWQSIIETPLNLVPTERWQDLEKSLTALAGGLGLSPYTLHLLYLVVQLPALKALYEEKGIAEEYFFDAACDLRFKHDECMTCRGIHGTVSFGWHLAFWQLWRMSLGRLTYDRRVCTEEEAITCAGIEVQPGAPVCNLHIPSGSPLGRAERLDSYRKAFEFFGHTKEYPLVVFCNSWLISPDHLDMLSASSNIIDFINDFDMLGTQEREGFPDAWRVFGAAAWQPLNTWPTDNSLRRGYVKLLKSGQNARNGRGILIFDGEKLLTGHHN